MKTTIDAAGRLVIPGAIRRQAGLRAGMTLDLRWRDGHIEIEPAALQVRQVKRGRFLVAIPETETEQLTTGIVETTRQELARERILED